MSCIVVQELPEATADDMERLLMYVQLPFSDSFSRLYSRKISPAKIEVTYIHLFRTKGGEDQGTGSF